MHGAPDLTLPPLPHLYICSPPLNIQVIKKTFLKNVKYCRDVIVEKVYKQGRDVIHHVFDLIAPYIVVAYITVYA